jgi:hypothetical protein
MTTRLGWLALPLGTFALDFASKAWVLRIKSEHQSLTVLSNSGSSPIWDLILAQYTPTSEACLRLGAALFQPCRHGG